MKINVAFNRDCMEAMKEFPDKFFDLAVVDPPYGDGCSQSLNVERESRPRYNRFGGLFDQYKNLDGQTGGWHGKHLYHLGTSNEQEADGQINTTQTKKSSRGTLPRNRNTLTSCFASHATR